MNPNETPHSERLRKIYQGQYGCDVICDEMAKVERELNEAKELLKIQHFPMTFGKQFVSIRKERDAWKADAEALAERLTDNHKHDAHWDRYDDIALANHNKLKEQYK